MTKNFYRNDVQGVFVEERFKPKLIKKDIRINLENDSTK